MSDVFINFRSDDEPSAATMIERDLSARFGSEKIFRDSKSIRAGDEYPERMLSAVRGSRLMIAVIGPRWLTARHADGGRALDNEQDWIRRELLEAKKADVRVVPVLIGKTPKLVVADLPAELAWLADRQFRKVNNRQAEADLAALAAEIEELVPGLRDRTRNGRETGGPTHVTNVGDNFGAIVTGDGDQHNSWTNDFRGRGARR
jgi:TIR domain-containing protein